MLFDIALLKYIKQQSNKTLLELEYQFTPRKKGNGDEDDNHGGRQWSRWILGNAQPEIGTLTTLYWFACDQLIQGEWEENGNESQWAQLLPAVTDPRLSFLIDKKSTLLEILKQLKSPLVTTRILSAIATGYYLPSPDDMRKIFWSKPPKEVNTDSEYVSWNRIWAKNDVEKTEMELMLTGILVNLEIPVEDRTSLEEFAGTWGLTGNELGSWADQVHQQIQRDAQSLSEIRYRVKHLYSNKFKWTEDLDDEKIATQNYIKMHEYLAMAENKFKDYAEATNSVSKSSRMFSLFSQLSHEHFTLNGCKHRIVWNYPTVEIL